MPTTPAASLLFGALGLLAFAGAVFLPHLMGPAYPQWLHAVIVASPRIVLLQLDHHDGIAFRPEDADPNDTARHFVLQWTDLEPEQQEQLRKHGPGLVVDNPLFDADADPGIDTARRDYFRLPM